MKRQKGKKTKNKKRILYCDVRAVSHSCDVFTQAQFEVCEFFTLDSIFLHN